MKNILRNPAVNAVCISLFTAFYSLVFIVTSRHVELANMLYFTEHGGSISAFTDFWVSWSRFLAEGWHACIAYALIALTALIVILLCTRRRPYDEYHVDRLLTCLVTAMFLTLVAIALFYVTILSESNGIVEKFTLFIAIHWTTVVFADLIYVLVSKWR